MNPTEQQLSDQLASAEAELFELRAKLAAAEDGKHRATEAMASMALRLADALQAQADAEARAEGFRIKLEATACDMLHALECEQKGRVLQSRRVLSEGAASIRAILAQQEKANG